MHDEENGDLSGSFLASLLEEKSRAAKTQAIDIVKPYLSSSETLCLAIVKGYFFALSILIVNCYVIVKNYRDSNLLRLVFLVWKGPLGRGLLGGSLEIFSFLGGWFLSSAGAGKNCSLSMRLSSSSPVLDKHSAPLGPDILSSTGAGVWRKAPKAFPDSSSVLDTF